MNKEELWSFPREGENDMGRATKKYYKECEKSLAGY
jgi:hypothetical protein